MFSHSPCSNWKKMRSALSNSSSGKFRMKRVCTSSRASSAAPDGALSSTATAVPIDMARISSAVGMCPPPDAACAYENSGEVGCVFTTPDATVAAAAAAWAWAWAFPPRPRLFFREDDAAGMAFNWNGHGVGTVTTLAFLAPFMR